MIDFEHAREAMVDNQLRTTGVTDRRLLSVMGRVPRERFVPDARRVLAYIDECHKVASVPDRFLASPAQFAKLVQLAEIGHEDVVLDIGCATGYTTAVLAGLANAVVGLDDRADLVAQANENLAALDIGNAAVVEGPLEEGVTSEAPFDVIIIEGEIDEVPKGLFAQLRDGGRLVAVISEGLTASAHIYVRSGEDIAGRTEFNATVPRLPAMQRQPAFEF